MKGTNFPLRGTSLMVATIIGGGMFALPVAFVHVWFIKGLLILSVTGILMLITGLILVDITMRFPSGASFHTFTHTLLGPVASVFIGVAFCFVLYLLTYAYISGAASILWDLLPPDIAGRSWLPIILLSLTTSLILWAGGRLPGILLSGLIAAKFTLFLLLFAGAAGGVKVLRLFDFPGSPPLQYYLPIVPVCVIAFGFHGSVPSLTRMYRGDNHRAVLRSLYYGFAVSLTVYAFWLTLTMGALTPQAIRNVSDEGGNIGAFITALNIHRTTSATSLILVAFSCIAVLASLMSASIGLSDYLEDTLNKINCQCSRPLAIFLTYFPPALACIIAPQGFLSALSYAGISLVLWSIILPPYLLIKARRSTLPLVYNFPGNNFLLKIIIVIGVIVWLLIIYSFL
ncbi:aromatic amino acid transport family protein [Klebsiella aerogenes]|uniref:aromatic amino acid transport family protein n=1 Tax=Klebsiella aerogenes TaxID=548 RepID=UPI00254BB7A5|nr:aromatic amino acid transport family protein [Klebsiella aerogenes]MDK7098783.1 aromatic amino acid transport family protein [Klebsiella aerogenes]MDK7643952.1 aromatic amino acid transport family protein [Klebsiella aerogenes]MDK7848739.1 aromatic amino acid transport family protein [Klebsiella aerogenes]MDK8311068.1 aromatic amino acid transport family protein [Klebsiella aerogenes]HEJ0314110.1 tyrosine permease [Klebsiella aerogenes]